MDKNISGWKLQKFYHVLYCVIILLTFVGNVSTQEDLETEDTATEVEETPVYRFEVTVDSAFVRVLPSREAERAASVFREDMLEVIGRNLDGTWFEVRRPGRMTNLGWIFNETGDHDFRPEVLPMTDTQTGLIDGGIPVTGNEPAAYAVEGITMRDFPSLDTGEPILTVEIGSTVPVLFRNQDGQWLKVNYLGTIGWIVSFPTRGIDDVLQLPLAPELPELETFDVLIIPPEIQLGQVQRVRDFISPKMALAIDMRNFWDLVGRGEIMPCDAPASVASYQYSATDIQQLPELKRFLPRLELAVQTLNDAIIPLQRCGVLSHSDVRAAGNSAINAVLNFEATLGALANVEEIIR